MTSQKIRFALSLLVYLVIFLPVLVAAQIDGVPNGGNPDATAPSGLSYTNNQSYPRGTAITTLSPTLASTGGVTVTYSVSPTLPAGLSISSTTGAITGTPTTVTSATNYTITVTNIIGNTTFALNIAVYAVAPSGLSFTNNRSYPVGTAITTLSPTLTSTGGATITYSASLPAGLSINSGTGAITGTPTTATAATNYTITATNSAGSTTFALNITVTAIAPSGLSYSNNMSYPIGTAITTLSPTLTSTGGTTVTYSASLPAGLSINSTSGAITGSPTTVTSAANYTITATNSAGNTSFSLNITVTALAPTLGTFSAISKNYGDVPFGLTAPTSNSAGTFSYTSSNISVATISGNIITIVGAGTSTITANQAANGDYLAGNTTATLTVSSIAPTLSISNSTVSYTGSPLAATVTGTGGGTVSNILYNGSSTEPTNVGTYSITANIASTDNYTALTGASAGTFTVNAVAPSAPISDTAISDNAQVYVSYTAPTNNGGSAIIDYTITAIPSTGSNIVRTGITANPYTFDGLTNGKTYTFTVAARNIAGTGATLTTNAATPSATTIWNGTSWSAGTPDASQIAVVAAPYTSNSPITCTKLTINSGVTFINNSTITATSSPVTINGTVIGTGSVVLAGSSSQTIVGNGLVSNLTISNTSGVTIPSGSSLAVTGVLTLEAGTFNTGGNVTLKSTSITNSGILGPIALGASINGNINVERFIPKGFRAFRDLSANGVYNPANTLYNTWQESGVNHPGYGMFITGGAPDSIPSHITNGYNDANGIDRTLTGYSSAYYYKAGWDTVINTKTTVLNPFQSFRVLVRGDRNFNLDTSSVIAIAGPKVLAMQNSTTLRASGLPITGTVTFSTSGITNAVTGATYNSATYGLNNALTGYTYLANPYACPIVFDSVYNNSTNIKASYYYLDPTIGSTGAWVSYNVLDGFSSKGVVEGKYIQAGQGFLVGNNNSTSPIVVLKEAFKATGSGVRTSVFGATAPKSAIVMSLLKQAGNASMKMDAAVAVFSNQFSNGLGAEDNSKFSNATDNLSIIEGGQHLSIDGRLPATESDVLGISLGQLSGTDYSLVIDVSAFKENSLSPYLLDAYSNKTTALAAGIATIAFTADPIIAATFQNRFSVIFKPTTLSVNGIIANATANGNVATITWSTVGEKSVATFEIEKSTNGSSFTSIGQLAAKNTATASYAANDNVVVSTTTYYRIKAINVDGTIAYSNVIKLNISNSQLTSIYPNPLVGKRLNLDLNTVKNGKYLVTISNALGQKVAESIINHIGGMSTYSVNIESTVAKGVYNVVIKNIDCMEQVYQSTLSVQ